MKKKKIIILIISIIILISITSVIYIKNIKTKIIIKDKRKIEINTKTYNTDYIKKIKNGKIISKKEKIKTNKLGKKKVTIYIKNHFNKKEKYTYYIEIIDTKKPKITYQKELTTEEGNQIDLLKDVKVEDNSKEKIEAKIEGEYDINKEGTYNLFYVAKDSSKNETKKPFTLIVTKKQISESNDTFTTSKGYKGYTKDGMTYIDGLLIANKTYSLPSNYNPGLDEETIRKANEMFEAAKKEGLNIFISSGFRSYGTQDTLYNNYVRRDGKQAADTYSARPGHSEHQTGLAFDVNEVSSAFDNTPEANWLANNCYKYGFILRYPKGKESETGYIYESWHFRYVGNIASKLYNNGDWITLETYFGITSKYNY